MARDRLGCHLLVAEDNPVSRSIVENQLVALGYCVDVVENGLQALAALDRDCYDLVLMDCQMPEVDGYEATRRLRQAGKRLPVIALTAHAVPDVRERCLAAGMDGYVAKELASTELRSVLHAWLPEPGEPGQVSPMTGESTDSGPE